VANGVAEGERIAAGSLDGVANAHAFNSAMAKASRPIADLCEACRAPYIAEWPIPRVAGLARGA
jgi:hypothetical protein